MASNTLQIPRYAAPRASNKSTDKKNDTISFERGDDENTIRYGFCIFKFYLNVQKPNVLQYYMFAYTII